MIQEEAIEKSVFEEIPVQKIYSEKAVRVGTFLGGPLVAGYCIAENFKVFNDYKKAKKTWIITSIFTVIIISLIFLIPENINIPNIIFPVLYMSLSSYFIKKFQEQNINDHISKGGEYFNWKRTTLVTLIGLLTIVAVIFSFAFLSDTTSGISATSKEYGTMHHEIVYESNVNVEEADKIASAFEKTTFFDQAQTKFVHLKKVDNNYEISISCTPEVENDANMAQAFIDLRNDMQKYFPKNKIIFNLVIDNLDNVVKRIE